MLHLAMKAFYPGQAAVPVAACRHDLEVPRDDRVPRPDGARSSASTCSSTSTRTACADGINPFDHGSNTHTHIMKTVALRQALDKYGFDAAFGGARRDEEKSRAKERIFSFRNAQPAWDPKNQRPEMWKHLQHARRAGRIDPRLPALELDRARHLAIHPAARTSRSCRSISPSERPVVERDGMLIMVDDDRMKLRPGETVAEPHGALPHARLLSADRRDRIRRRPRSRASSARC